MTAKLKYWRKDANWLGEDTAKDAIERGIATVTTVTNARDRWRAARVLSHAAASIAFNDDTLTLAAVEQSLDALGLAQRNGGRTEFSGRAASFLARERQTLLGLSDPTILFEKSRKIRVDCACVAIGTSPDVARDWLILQGQPAINALNNGNLYVLYLGSDGTFTVRLRFIDGSLPILAASEYGKVENTGPIGYLEGGRVFAGEPGALEKGIMFDTTEPMLVQPYAIARGRSVSLTFVICRTDKKPEPFDVVPEV